MFDSIIQDVKQQFSYGNAVVRLIIINTAIFIGLAVILALIGVFGGPNFRFDQAKLMSFLSLNSNVITDLKRPWVFFTHMFIHRGLWHFVMNMLVLYWFGRIFGDLMGDRRVVPLYILGGLAGALFFIVGVNFLTPVSSSAIGASAAVSAIVIAAAMVAPDYLMHLILIGPVKLKFIALAFIIIDLVGLGAMDNTGGHYGHFGGMAMGWFYIYMVRNGTDLATYINNAIDWIVALFDSSKKPKKSKKSHLKVKYKSPKVNKSKGSAVSDYSSNYQTKLDTILDKISKGGMASLTQEEKEFLDKASDN